MAKIKETIIINAPVEQIFDYVRETTNLPEVWPNLLEVKDVERLPNGGNRYRCIYQMIGIRFEVNGEDVEHITNQRIVSEIGGSIPSTIIWQFQPQDGKTKLTFEAKYTVPTRLLGRLAEGIIVRINKKNIEEFLDRLKARFAQP